MPPQYPDDRGEVRLPDIELSTHASPLPSRRPIWNVRSSYSGPNSLNTKLYETSARDLIGRDPDCVPFFDTHWKDRYGSLWLPTGTDSLVWHSTSSNSSLLRQGENSWFWTTEGALPPMTNLGKTSFPSFTFSPVVTTEDAPTSEEPPRKRQKKGEKVATRGCVLRGRKIRVVPTKEQTEILRKCIGVHRHIFNECVDMEKAGEIQGASGTEMRRVRTLLSASEHFDAKPWKGECPSLTRQQAVEEYFRAKKAALSNLRAGNISHFSIEKKSRFKALQETIPWERYRFVDERVYDRPNHKGRGSAYISIPYDRKEMRLRIRGKVPSVLRGRVDPKSIRTEVKLSRTRLGYWYAFIQVEIPQVPRYPDTPEGDVVALDPGVRTFQTWYSSDGSCGEVGKQESLEEALHRADNIKSELDTFSGRSRSKRHLRRRFLRALERVRNRVADLHNKVASWLVHRFRLILLPQFSTQGMVQGGTKFKLRSRTCRNMLTWSHYGFQRKVIEQSQKFTDVVTQIVNEAYTTKTCGRCGFIHEVGGSTVFHCPECGLRSGRDIHASRNVLLRQLKFIIA